MQIFNPHFDVLIGCFVFGLGLFAFQKISLGFGRLFFIGGGIGCSCLRLRGGLQWSFGGFARNLLRRLTASGSFVLIDNGTG